MFDDDLWDFTEVIGLPRHMSRVSRRFDFAAITSTGWRLVAKEQIMAMLAPRHDAVMPLPHAYRTPLHLLTAFSPLAELTRFLNWLDSQGITSLAGVDDGCCEAWLAHRRYLLDGNGQVAGERSPATRRAAAQTVAALYLTGTLGPHAPGLLAQVRAPTRDGPSSTGTTSSATSCPPGRSSRCWKATRREASRCRWPPSTSSASGSTTAGHPMTRWPRSPWA
jgi:hypothetical protein